MKILIPSVKRGAFRTDSIDTDAEFKRVRKQILARDNHTCQYCGFKAKKFQEVHHLDDNHLNSASDNLLTCCVLCHMTNHIGFIGAQKKASIIYVPDAKITHAEFNNLQRTLWCSAHGSNKTISRQANEYLDRLLKLTVNAQELLGTDDPCILGDIFLQFDSDTYSKRWSNLSGVYVLHDHTKYQTHIKYWSSIIWKNQTAGDLPSLANMHTRKWANNKYGSNNLSNIKKLLNIKG